MPALLSTAYLAPVSYFAILFQAGQIFIEVNETYPKQTYRNRCHIYSANGLLALTIPVKKVYGNHTQTKDIEIDYSLPWQKTHWRSIQSAYSKSPYFLHFQHYFTAHYSTRVKYLVDWNNLLMQPVFKILGIPEIRPVSTVSFEQQATGKTDWRYKLSPKRNKGIDENFTFPRYMQAFEEFHGFIPNLSIVDLLFNEGPSALHYLTGLTVKSPDLYKNP